MTHRTGLRLFAALAITAFSLSRATAGDEAIRTEFRDAYSPNFPALQDFYTNVIAKTATVFYESKTTVFRDDEAKYAGRNYLITVSDVVKNNKTGDVVRRSPRRTEGNNSRYVFGLKKGGDGQDDKYIVNKIAIHKDGDRTELCYLCAPFADIRRGFTYREMADDPNVTFVSLEACNWHEKYAKCLTIEFPWQPEPGEKPQRIKAECYFSPLQHWVCLGRREWSDARPGQYSEELYTYRASEGDHLADLDRIDRWDYDEKNPSRPPHSRETHVTEFRHVGTIPDPEFRLSALGFPEPPGVEWQRASRTWLWLLAGGLVAAAAAYVFHRLRRATASAA